MGTLALLPGNGQLAGHVLGTAKPEGPVAGSVFDIANEDVLAGDPHFRKLFSHRGKEPLLGLLGPATLGKDLDHHHSPGALEAQAGVLGEDLALRVFGEDVEVVPLRDAVLRKDGIVDAAAQLLQLIGSAAFVDVNANQLNVAYPLIVCTDILTNSTLTPQDPLAQVNGAGVLLINQKIDKALG